MKSKEKAKELKQKIQEEIWRLQMCDYLTENSYINLNQIKKELKEL
tara:strand:+ start:987 stop:1124 length:138 start_codon:yes stop_codon:yes gene_type:complete